MRLLKFDGRGELSLTDDLIEDIPRYAILSHTWARKTDEVTFKDLQTPSDRIKAGYEKIRFCGEQAKKDGLHYFWVDTCCIDKSNSTELAEAINSMFSWYSNAAKCYVYLSDVSTPALDTVNEPDQLPWESAFRKSRWFTRGWTLQELIAPRTVEFFSKERCPLGDKKSLEQAIHQITGIALEALRGDRPLHEFDIHERMSWAKNRETTRREDAAYCLFGIFDVHLPLIYGEGREKALIRLRKEIQETQNLRPAQPRDDGTASLFTMSDNRPFKTFTSSLNDAPVDLLSIHFIEREQELGLIRNAHQVCEESAPGRCAIWGIPGVGKTQLAIRYTKMFLEEPTVSAVFWMSCCNVEKLQQSFSRLLNLIDHPDQSQLEQAARVIAARRWLEHPEVSGILRWLLVLDNVDVTTLDFLRENLPRQGKQGAILITTRTEAVAQAVCKTSGRLQFSFELEPPAAEDAINFFLKSAGINEKSMSSASRRQVADLITSLGCLPFAIEHAASFMTQSSQTIDGFTKLYQGNQKSHIINWQDLSLAYEAKSISAMFASHLHKLRQSSPNVLALLNTLVFWDPDKIELETIKTGAKSLGSLIKPTEQHSNPEQHRQWKRWCVSKLVKIPFIFFEKRATMDGSDLEPGKNASLPCQPESLIKLASSEVQLQSALQQLQMLSFIKRRSAHEVGAYNMHDLTQSLVQVALESEGSYSQWFRCAVRIACAAFRQIEDPALPKFWHRSEGLISHVLSLTKYSELVDHENADLLTTRTSIAAYWCNRGRYREARETYQQILGVSSNALHDAGIETTPVKLSLAEVTYHLGKLSESMSLYEEVRQIQEPQLGPEHPDTLLTVEKLALVYKSQARFTEARSMLEHVLESRKTSLGPDHLDTIRTMDSLAMTINKCARNEHDQAQYVEAENLYKEALARREAQLGKDHLDTLWTADNLASNYRGQGRHSEAAEIYERVLEVREIQLGEDHPQTLWTLANLASAYTRLCRLNEAEMMYKRAIVSNAQRLGQNHQETLWAVAGLADIYHRQRRFEEAISLYTRAARGKEDRVGGQHPSVRRLRQKLEDVYRDQKDFNQVDRAV